MKKYYLIFAIHALLGFIGVKVLHKFFYPNELALFIGFFIFGFLFLISSRFLSLYFFYFATKTPKTIKFSFKKSTLNDVGLLTTIKFFSKNIVMSLIMAVILGLIMSWFKDKTAIGLIILFMAFKYDHSLFDKNAEDWIEECKLKNKAFQFIAKIGQLMYETEERVKEQERLRN